MAGQGDVGQGRCFELYGNGIVRSCRESQRHGFAMSCNGIVVFRIESQRQGKERLGKARLCLEPFVRFMEVN